MRIFWRRKLLAAAFPGPALRPADPVAFNRMMAWARFTNEVFMPAANTLGCRRFLAPALAGNAPPEGVLDRIALGFVREGWRRAYANDYPDALVEESRRKLRIAAARIERALADGPWLAGDSYTLADVDAFAIARSLPLLAPGLAEGHARMAEWLRRMAERPAVRTALATGAWTHPETAFAPGSEHARWG